MMYADQCKKASPSSSAISVERGLQEWICSQDIPSDASVHVGGSIFALHKAQLVSKCGYFRKVAARATDLGTLLIEIPLIPGGADAFEFVAKFCYGINFDIHSGNVAMLRCVAEFLEMTEEYASGNLIARTEAYLEEVAVMSFSGAVTVLHKSESLLPLSDKVKIVSRCIDAIVYLVLKDTRSSLTLNSQDGSDWSQTKTVLNWQTEELTVLRIDMFQRVLMALRAGGFHDYLIGLLLMMYVQKSLRSLDLLSEGRMKMDPKQSHEKRVVMETIVRLLPTERNSMSVSFLSMLLRASVYLETTVACRLDLEKRMGMQLEQAVLDDLLVHTYSSGGNTTYDVDSVQRIFMNYHDHLEDGNGATHRTNDDFFSSPRGEMELIGRLIESYIAQVASDSNLTISKFIGLVELIPEQARVNEDNIYRAVDIYLKAHSFSDDLDRMKICRVMNCEKLSREACAHAAQNTRLPVQIVVQVLHQEQQRIRAAMEGTYMGGAAELSPLSPPQKLNTYYDELIHLRKENYDLKLEMVRMRLQIRSIEKTPVPTEKKTSGHVASSGKPPLPKNFITSMSKKLSRLYPPFMRSDNINSTIPEKVKSKPPKNWRHSIS